MSDVDVIVVSSSSDYLKQIILIEGGEDVYKYYEKEKANNPHQILLSIPGGNLLCKRIFFVQWKSNENENENILRQSMIDLISNVIQNVLLHSFTSVAFPPIGCGHSNLNSTLIIQTLINQLIYQIRTRNLSCLFKFIILPDQENLYQQFSLELDKSEEKDNNQLTNDNELPSTWELSAAGNQYRFLLSSQSNEYQRIQQEFCQLMKGKMTKIVEIERIQNERWYSQYLAHKKDFFKRLNEDTEKRLYHGCPKSVTQFIIEDCFNRSFAGVNGTSYGVGVYFSSNPRYSHRFSQANSNGERSMFLARVLVGKTVLGNSSMKSKPKGFDTTTDGNHIFVTYHDAQAYAEYLITYK